MEVATFAPVPPPPLYASIRPAQTVQQQLDGASSECKTWIRHPAYPQGRNLLLILYTPDHPTGGIHHETARTACGIIAGNRWDGYFTKTIDAEKILDEPNGLLTEPEYFFHVPYAESTNPVPSTPYKYPIVPSFDEWQFPHDNLPPFWSSLGGPRVPRLSPISNLSSALKARDKTCRMSDHEESCQVAHMVPVSVDDWFSRNEMNQYTEDYRRPADAISDLSNTMLLRADLHVAFDQQKFVFIPKATPSSGLPEWVVHIMVYSPELRNFYHNTKLHDVRGVSREFLFARFAHTIFPQVQGFLQRGIEWELLSVSLAKEYGKIYTASSDECKRFVSQTGRKSRSQSPTKRARPETVSEQEQGSDLSVKRVRLDEDSPQAKDQLPTPSNSGPAAQFLHKGQEDLAIEHLREEHLKRERLHSDPDGTWVKEREWLQKNEGRPMSPASLERYFLAKGVDIYEV